MMEIPTHPLVPASVPAYDSMRQVREVPHAKVLPPPWLGQERMADPPHLELRRTVSTCYKRQLSRCLQGSGILLVRPSVTSRIDLN